MRLFMVVPRTPSARDLLYYCQHSGEKFISSVVNTGDKLFPGVVDAGQK
jgi:hypothetical protein